jgi:hypothetical protein
LGAEGFARAGCVKVLSITELYGKGIREESATSEGLVKLREHATLWIAQFGLGGTDRRGPHYRELATGNQVGGLGYNRQTWVALIYELLSHLHVVSGVSSCEAAKLR